MLSSITSTRRLLHHRLHGERFQDHVCPEEVSSIAGSAGFKAPGVLREGMFGLKSFRKRFYALSDHLRPPLPVFAHCDIPCGIYDPHEAQIAALTVIRMDQLIGELPPPAADAKAEEKHAYTHKLARYTAVKEQHAEKLKHEIRVIYGDYITADMVKKFPELPDLVFKIWKQASKARQEVNLAGAQELLASVHQFAEVFWKTKNVATRKVPSNQKSGGEIVLPA